MLMAATAGGDGGRFGKGTEGAAAMDGAAAMEGTAAMEGAAAVRLRRRPEPLEPSAVSDGIPIFRPTMDEFRSFREFVSRIGAVGMQSGIVKVVPPREWRDALPDVSARARQLRVKNPIEQHISGRGGFFTQANIEKRRTLTLAQWRRLCDAPEHQPPARRGEARTAPAAAAAAAARPGAATRLPSPHSPHSGDDEDVACAATGHGDPPLSPPSTVVEQPQQQQQQGSESGDELLLAETSALTDDRCAELEKIYWKTLMYATPLYGADMLGSLFDERTKEWNVANLDNILNKLGKRVPGVNSAYLYFGMWKATYAWHVEDMDLYSINYIHFGAPKQWYSVPQAYASRFESLMQKMFSDDFATCPQFLRHKTFHSSPAALARHGIKVNKVVHRAGEFVITFPFGYHSGYNLGFNCAESVNFATDDWFEIGCRARRCLCIPDAVVIDVYDLFKSEREDLLDLSRSSSPKKESAKRKRDEDEQGDEHFNLITT